MVELLTAVTVGVVAVAVALAKAVVRVPAGHVGLVERRGRHRRTLPEGTHLVVPFLDLVPRTVDLREQTLPLRSVPIVAGDDVLLHLDLDVCFTVTDPVLATHEVLDVRLGLERLATLAARDVVGSWESEEALASRGRLGHLLRGELIAKPRRWGVEVRAADVVALARAGGT
ncbi:SPFH domain-containing protein [Nocardioides marmoraquaticus]